jgi:hypothetical protein
MATSVLPPRIAQLPLLTAYFEGHLIEYVSTDISDKDMSIALGLNFAPKLVHALPAEHPAPGSVSAASIVYKFIDEKQPSIFQSVASRPELGETDQGYSPVWQLYLVEWLPKAPAKRPLLTSEEQLLQAQDDGFVSVKATRIAVNCPILPQFRLPRAR